MQKSRLAAGNLLNVTEDALFWLIANGQWLIANC
jgi:hypothetical protein